MSGPAHGATGCLPSGARPGGGLRLTSQVDDGQAVYSTRGNTKKGTNAAEDPVPGFQRVTSASFVKEL